MQTDIVNVDEHQSTPISHKGVISVDEDKYLPAAIQGESFSFLSIHDETGQSSERSEIEFVCDLCVETKSHVDSLKIKDCSHAYCKDCIIKYVGSKLGQNITIITCPEPGCAGYLEPEYCRYVLPIAVFDRWGELLCQAMIIESQKFYCPFKDCSVLLVRDGEEIIKRSECPYCRRLFCAECKVSWHSGIPCAEFQELNKDEREKEDLMLVKLAHERCWKRCPNCRIYVAKREGCNHIDCRCGTAFCYQCGSLYDPNEGCCEDGI